MQQRSGIGAGGRSAHRRLGAALIFGIALLSLQVGLARAADRDAVRDATQALAQQTRHLANDAGQFYLAWWIPQALAQAILADTPNAAHADRLQALQPYIVFAIARAQVGEHGLVDLHDKADLLRGSRLTVNGQVLTAAPADQNGGDALAALDMIKPALVAMLGQFNRGIEFALYRPTSGMPLPDPTLAGSMQYTLYHKRFDWTLPVWAPAAPSAPVAAAQAVPPPVSAPMSAPMSAPVPLASAVSVPAAARLPPAPAPPPAATASLPATAAVPATAAPPGPLPVQRRKIDPTSGEEFPERYNYNPYTGQKLVSQ